MQQSGRVRLALAWLQLGFFMQIPVGLSVAFAYQGPLWTWHRSRAAQALYGLPEMPALAQPVLAQLQGMLGATMACWALVMLWVVRGPLSQGSRDAGGIILMSTLLWFVPDTALSAAHGVWVNVAFNTAALMMICAPLALLWSSLKD